MSEEKHAFEENYSDSDFWDKVITFAKTAGIEVIQKALWLYYAAQSPLTPSWAKTVIYGALGYFIFPVDAIPDVVPVVGYADDLGVLAAALGTVSMYVDDEVKALASQKLKDWFGE
ncbi:MULTISPECIES: YkvA family protein [unclassified Methylophilus]|uniref:YkvA family protein n=1 Tax=unclassified Methylophilus TaxID=2630143 RepID=UPI0006FCAE99|nr:MULTISPECIES: YkvA family protein [unclassified Methylophilus]KQT43820.1 hypothetical protein ASG34_03340 [Methylophilus sp. Leaf416]KQT59304.1 hypothetical protein ASG44_03345 [Methylophilus sp. Leaf459]